MQTLLFLAFAAAAQAADTDVLVIKPEIRTIIGQLVDGRDISFRRLPATAGLSQTRVSQISQDCDGFLWFGTQSGLNRFDGYKCRVFKHDPAKPDSLSGVYLYSLFRDRSCGLWAGSDQYLDRFDPAREAFTRVQFPNADPAKPVNFGLISQDSAGMLWLATSHGLYGLNPANQEVVHYRHDLHDPATLGQEEVQWADEDRTGAFWVGMRGSLEQLDRRTGKVQTRIVLENSGFTVDFHEDKFGVFWILDGNGVLGIYDRQNRRLTQYVFQPERSDVQSRNSVFTMLEDRDGTMWFGTGGFGLLKYDRDRDRFIRYTTRPGDPDSLADNRVISLFQDREGNIWVGLHQAEPSVFSPNPPAFEKFTYQSGNPNSLGSQLVSVIHEDSRGWLWLGADRMTKLLNRKTGEYRTFDGVTGHEILSIAEQGPETLWMGTAGLGLKRYDLKTGSLKTYKSVDGDLSTLCSDFVEKLLMDREGRLWEASWGGLCYLDFQTDRFTRFSGPTANRTYHSIAEDRDGSILVGSNMGLQRLDLKTGSFREFVHNEEPGSLSDNRVNSIYISQAGDLWVGTQNGLDRLDRGSGRFIHYNERDGIAGNVISCILEDGHRQLWMSTNAGVTSFDTANNQFRNYSFADGLPGPDLTGWGACFKSNSGEMFFGGFSGATAFWPDRIPDSSDTPPVVLTDFRLFGDPVKIGNASPLRRSITHTESLSLSHEQNTFSLEFSALSYSNATTNRYRYKLDNVQPQWVASDSEERRAGYTTLPSGTYTFHVQGATSRGRWSEPGVVLQIRILPPWWSTWTFRAIYITAGLICIWSLYRYRIGQLKYRYQLRVEERVNERTRVARELHDTLLQSFQGLMLHFQAVDKLLPAGKAKEQLEKTLERADKAIAEGRSAVYELRSPLTATNDLADAMKAVASEMSGDASAAFDVLVEGASRDLQPIVRDELYRISREALRNAFKHAGARRIEAEISYGERVFRLRIRDDGQGIPAEILEQGRPGHYGLSGIRERARQIGADLSIWSRAGSGTEIELALAGSIAYGTSGRRYRFPLFRKSRTET